jgi:lipopolysaccharide export system permease protein
MSIVGTVTWVALLRLCGFVSTVFGASYPLLLSLQFIAMAVALGGGYFVIRRGVILEPPTFINDGFAFITERIVKRLAVSS